MNIESEFEEWFLKQRNRPLELTKVKRDGEWVYLIATTKMLFKQYVTISNSQENFNNG